MTIIESLPELRDRLLQPSQEIELDFWDKWEPIKGVEASFGIKDPEKPGNTQNGYCIGFTYRGKPEFGQYDPRNWRCSGILYWPEDDYIQSSDTQPVRVSRRSLDGILKPRGTSVSALLGKYLEKLKDTPSESLTKINK